METFKDGLRVIVGNYERDQLNGKAKITYNDDTVVEGYFKVICLIICSLEKAYSSSDDLHQIQDGVQHGFSRTFDRKGRLTFMGNYRNGKPFGVCWRIIRYGGCVVGRVDSEGQLTGVRLAYLYPDFRTALVGTFNEGYMEFGQVACLKAVVDDRGVKVKRKEMKNEMKRGIKNTTKHTKTLLIRGISFCFSQIVGFGSVTTDSPG